MSVLGWQQAMMDISVQTPLAIRAQHEKFTAKGAVTVAVFTLMDFTVLGSLKATHTCFGGETHSVTHNVTTATAT